MKLDNLRTNIGAALIVMLLAIASTGVVTAQNSTNRTDTSTTRTADRDDDTDWGWLGLLGLVGLAGLIPKKRAVDVDRDRDVTNRSTGSTTR